MRVVWQTSSVQLFEMLRPVGFLLSVLISTWVLGDAIKRGSAIYSIAAWTTTAFLFPHIILPLYLIARILRYERIGKNAGPLHIAGWKRFLPLTYMLLALAATLIYLGKDYRSVDAHLARANRARLLDQRERTIRELRTALKLEENPHTHKLLGIELANAGRFEEALIEFNAAANGGEPDDNLSFRIAAALESLNKQAEAIPHYQRFLQSPICQQNPSGSNCETAQTRAYSLIKNLP